MGVCWFEANFDVQGSLIWETGSFVCGSVQKVNGTVF